MDKEGPKAQLDEGKESQDIAVKEEVPLVDPTGNGYIFDAWFVFSQSTSFDGVKYCNQPDEFKYRRQMWLIYTMLLFVIFFTIVFERTWVYLLCETTADLEFSYVEVLDFPLVTICNPNNYRLTKTTRHGLYDFIDDFYSSSEQLGFNLDAYDLEHVDTYTFITEAAHQLHDLVDSCNWRGLPCNLDKDFVRIMTDIGVCYTFNPSESDVNETGPDGGLSMILNIEQYEYMNGPHNFAGVKIHIHPSDEAPSMKDMGFLVAPGTHTFVAVTNYKVELMEPPYGNCVEKASHVSVCRLKCKAKYIHEKCNCVPAYMSNVTGVIMPICNMASTFSCLVKSESSFWNQGQCECSMICRPIIYIPNLSFSYLPKVTIDSTVLRENGKRKLELFKYRNATEVRQRVNHGIFDADKKILDCIKEKGQDLTISISETIDYLDNFTILSSEQEVIDMLNTTFEKADTFQKEVRIANSTIAVIGQLKHTLHHMAEVHSQFVERLAYCIAKESTNHNGYGLAENHSIFTNPECDHDIIEMGGVKFRQMMGEFPLMLNVILGMRDAYESFTMLTSNNVADKHKRCLDELTWYETKGLEIVNLLQQHVSNVLSIITDLNQTDSIEDALSMKHSLLSETETLTQLTLRDNFQRMITELSEPLIRMESHGQTEDEILEILAQGSSMKRCYWLADQMYLTNARSVLLENMTSLLSEQVTNHIHLVEYFEKFEQTINDIFTHHYSYVQNVKDKIDYYLNGTITKRELASTFQTVRTIRSLDKYTDTLYHFEQIMEDVTNFIYNCSRSAENMFKQMNQLEAPLLISSILVEMMKGDMTHNLTKQNSVHYLFNQRQLDKSKSKFHEIEDQLKNTTLKIVNSTDEFIKQITDTRKRLTKYKDDTEMDSHFYMENFVQVEIFYPELKHAGMMQHPAFLVIRLASEIGGYAGLLTGASVLTFGEYIDWLVIKWKYGQ